ncbi:WbqC family protein [Rufibacter soli]
MSTIAIMQPYFLPYLGYFQLIKSVDKFIFYDDVNYIKQGWINRNNILINNKASLFTVPLDSPSSFNLIKDTKLNFKIYPIWVIKFLKTIEQNYKKAPFYIEVSRLLTVIFGSDSKTIANLNVYSVILISKYLGLDTRFVESSCVYNNSYLKGQERIINICKQEGAKHYVNPIGGVNLYSKTDFLFNGIELSFIKTEFQLYKQFYEEGFVPGLSILDVLMFNSKEVVREMLDDYILT